MHALVESPLQLLCAAEAHAAGHTGARTRVLVPPGDRALARAARSIETLGLPDGLLITSGGRRRRSATAVDATLVVGDAFSGAVQTSLVGGPSPDRLVLVDAGLATVDLARRLVEGGPLVRYGAASGPTRVALGALARRRLRRLAAERRLVLCTALPLDDQLLLGLRAVDVHVVTHSFRWLASRPAADAPTEPTVVVGSPLVADGLVRADRYAAWVRGIACEGPVRYVPHRRHDSLVTALVERVPGLVVDFSDAPVEVRLSGLRPGQRVVTLPSTSAVTLTRLLSPQGVAVTVHSVPEDWWTPRTTPELREHLATATRLARRARTTGSGAAAGGGSARGQASLLSAMDSAEPIAMCMSRYR